MAADAIADAHRFAAPRNRFRGHVREGVLEGKSGPVKTIILKPMTFMNESGVSVQEAIAFHKIDLDQVYVIYDELDLAAGKIRVKRDGGNAGHNGLRSISTHAGNAFWRIRLGIGHPGDKSRVHGHVLGNFTKVEHEWLDPLLSAVAQAAPLLADGQSAQFMNKVSLLTSPKKDEPSPSKSSDTRDKSKE
jgi:PTH1 family peptidyl-tRNA hydrolase